MAFCNMVSTAKKHKRNQLVYIICDTTYMELKKHITNSYLLFLCVHVMEIKKKKKNRNKDNTRINFPKEEQGNSNLSIIFKFLCQKKIPEIKFIKCQHLLKLSKEVHRPFCYVFLHSYSCLTLLPNGNKKSQLEICYQYHLKCQVRRKAGGHSARAHHLE